MALAMAAMAWADERSVPNVIRIDADDDFDLIDDRPRKRRAPPQARPREPSTEDITRYYRAASKRARKAAKRLRDRSLDRHTGENPDG